MIEFHPHVEFKDETVKERAKFLHHQAIEVINEQAQWCFERKLPFVLTCTVSTPEEDDGLDRTSKAHEEGRAWDVRIRGWLEKAILEFEIHFDAIFRHLAAIGAKSGKPDFVVRHNNGHGDHFHCQLGRVYAIKEPLKKGRVV